MLLKLQDLNIHRWNTWRCTEVWQSVRTRLDLRCNIWNFNVDEVRFILCSCGIRISAVTSVLEERTASIFSVNPGFCLNTLPVGISVRMATVLLHSCRDIFLLFAQFVWKSWGRIYKYIGRIIVDTSENFKPQYYSTTIVNTVLAAQLGCSWWKLGVTSLTKIKTNEYFKK